MPRYVVTFGTQARTRRRYRQNALALRMAALPADPPTPYRLWVQAMEDYPIDRRQRGNRYRSLMREHGLLLAPGDEGYEDGKPWPHPVGEGDYQSSAALPADPPRVPAESEWLLLEDLIARRDADVARLTAALRVLLDEVETQDSTYVIQHSVAADNARAALAVSVDPAECVCKPGEGCDEEGDPGCAYCRALDCERPCPAEDDVPVSVDPAKDTR